MLIIFMSLIGITLFFTILFAIKKVLKEVPYYSKRDTTIKFHFEELDKDKK